MRVLLDHHMKKQGLMLWAILENDGWLELLDIPLVTFADLGIPVDAPDRQIWHFAQEHRIILLTANRNNKGAESLAQTIREENTPTSLPVLTIGSLDRMEESIYRDQCAERIVEVIMNIEDYLGAGRVFVP